MPEQTAIAVTFEEQIEPYSDEEGLVPGRVEDAGLSRRATLVNDERTTIYVTVSDDEVTRESLARVADTLVNGWDTKPQRIPKDINAFNDDIAVFEYSGPVGEPVHGITKIKVVTVDTDELYQSASLAEKNTDE